MPDPAESDRLHPDQVRRIQLRVLDQFLELCARHDLSYFAYYGTLIGCARHGGFIPWDDDIDLAMPRRDYERLLALDLEPLGLRLVSRHSAAGFPFGYAKLCDTSTLVVERLEPRYTGWGGVNLDIWPLDGLPRTALGRHANDLLVRALRLIILAKILPPRPGRSRGRTALLRVTRALSRPLSVPAALSLIDRLIVRPDGELVGSRLGGRGREQWFPASWYTPVARLQFEGRQLRAPGRYHRILRGLYGDYLELPPESQRRSQHTFEAFVLRDSSPDES